MDEANITIIGAGVVGLAIAAELSTLFDGIVVLEQHESFGQETSSRNSEVIHAGIYYPAGSLKARLCVEGAERIYALCKKHSIPHRKIGKLIVATNQSEVSILEALIKKGRANNAKNLVLLDKQEVKKKEPNVIAVAALHSPETGIVDSHALMKHFFDQAKARGVLFSFNSAVHGVTKEYQGYRINLQQDAYAFTSNIVINCAGLNADRIAEITGIDTNKYDYILKYCKASYFSYTKQSPVSRLIYPVPQENLVGLGVHSILDLGGALRFGPDSEYIDRMLDYTVDAGKKEQFYEGASKMIAGLDPEAFMPGMAGIRPKLQGPGEKARDFIIREETDKGLPGLINLIGIESPGLTSAPAIANMVRIWLKN
jgi:L-2-hydroxyglutarate oxidase LhgO